MVLEGKTAIVYGAGGAIGGAVSLAFAREGASLFLAGRRRAPLDATAARIRTATGSSPHVAEVDALDADAVDRHAAAVVEAAGGIDVSFNAVGNDHYQGAALVDLAPERFRDPLADRLTAQFLTARAAARHMAVRGSGVILMITAIPARLAIPLSTSFGPACAAVEGLARSLAAELGPAGIRVVCLRSAGSPDSPGVRAAIEARAAGLGTTPAEVLKSMEDEVMLRRLPTLADVGDVAVMMASPRASALTATVVNLTCGVIAD
jgi:3-oxoacyl-[acyl-carrier protein] reductase